MTERAAPDDTLCNALALRKASRYVTGVYDQALSAAGLRVTQFSILYKLAALGALTVNRMAAELVMDRTTLTRNLKPLERDALVASGPSATDRRERIISLTPAGQAKMDAVLPLWRQAQQTFEHHFGPARANDLRVLLQAVVDSGLHDLADDRA